MKKHLLLIFFLAFTKLILAQCGTIMVSSTTLQYPDTVTNLPLATQGISYTATIQFYTPSTYSGYTLNSITINSVSGLPSGFSYSKYPTNGIISAGNSGCIVIQCSNPLSALGTYPISISGTASVQTIGNVSSPIPGYKIQVIPPPLSFTNTKTNPTCNGFSNGNISINPSGGVSPYQYRINFGTFQSSPIFNNLSAGIYNFEVKDSLGTLSSKYDTLIDPAPLSIGSISGSNGVFVNSTQTYSVSSQSGVTYLWTITKGNVLSGQGTNSVSVQWASGGGNGKVLATISKNTCSAFDSMNVLISYTPLILSTVRVNETCSNSGNGSVTITASGGAAPYQYRMNTGSYQSSNIFNNLTAGIYSFDVKDSLNTLSSKNDTLTAPVSLSVGSISGVSSVIVNSTQTYSITSQSNVTYLWNINNGTLLSGQGTNSISVQWNSIAGNGKVIATISKNTCSVSDSMSVTIVNSPLSLSSTILNETCTNTGNGSITIIASGGTSPYQFKLNNGTYQSSPVFNNLSAGIYIVQVKDASNDTISKSDTLKAPSPLLVGAFTGIDSVATGSTLSYSINSQTNATYLWSITNGTILSGQGTNNISVHWPSTVGNGKVKVVISRNTCIASDSIKISIINLPLSIITTAVSETCENSGNGSITVLAQGGNAPYQYRLNNGTYQNSNVFRNLIAGMYAVQVKDVANNTIVNIDILEVQAPLALGEISGRNSLPVNFITTYNIPSQSNISYSWNIINGTVISGQGTNNISVHWASVASNGKVIPIITRKNCIVSDSINVSIIDSTLSFTSAINNESCPNKNNGSITVNAFGGTSPYLYSINNSVFQPSNLFNNLNPGVYIMKVSDTSNSVTQHTYTINAGKAIIAGTISGLTTVQTLTSINYSLTYQPSAYYFWSVTKGNIASGQGTSTAKINWGATSGNGSVNVKITSAAGCVDSSQLNVSINTTGVNEVSNSFSYQLYPNPCTNTINLSSLKKSLKGSTIKISDLLGRLIKIEQIKTDGEVDLNISDLNQGTYIIEVEKEGEISRTKLMKE
ncbi:MAG: T9SS type A sorting domain-containing protein [Bacteroidota bacterium]